jgi:inner membrane transporter RhtA
VLTDRSSGVLLGVAAMSSIQLGAALSEPLFDDASPAGLVWLRLLVAAAIFVALVRPRPRRLDARARRAAVLLGAASGGLTLFFFEAIARIPLGVAVTIEFLGPLAVALAGSRSVRDLAWVGLALAGVVALTAADSLGAGGGGLDPVGLLFAALAAVCWGLYIVLTQRVGAALPGVQGLAVSMPVAASSVRWLRSILPSRTVRSSTK